MNENNTFTSKEYVDLITEDYWKTRERLFSFSDSIQQDFKLVGITGPFLITAATLVSLIDNNLMPSLIGDQEVMCSFILFVAILVFYATFAFRDYYRAVILEHSLYAVWNQECQLKAVLNDFKLYDAEKSIRYADDWIQKFQKKYAEMIGIFTFMLMLPIIIVPPLVLFSMQGKSYLFAITYIILSAFFIVSYYYIGIRSFNRFERLFEMTN